MESDKFSPFQVTRFSPCPTGSQGKTFLFYFGNCFYAKHFSYLQIGEYDSDDGELWDDNEEDEDSDEDNVSGGSWETESEHSVKLVDESNMRSRLAASIERARIAMTKLETIFNDKCNSHTNLVIKQLLDVYKNCKCLDSFMNTSFFDESHFEDLLTKVRERSKSTGTQQAVHDQMQRLFSEEAQEDPDGSRDSTEELNLVIDF